MVALPWSRGERLTLIMEDLSVRRVVAPVRQQVYEQLKRAIIEHRFEVHQRLTERELTRLTGVSRPTVREALQQLMSEGLVATIPGKGWIVASLTQEEVADLYAVRAVMEGLAARRFAERATMAQIESLKAAFADIESTLVAGRDIADMMNAKDRFYEVLFAGAQSETITSQLGVLHARISMMRARSLGWPERPAQSVAELRRLVECLIARDADGAERASATHVRNAAAAVLSRPGKAPPVARAELG